MKHVIRNAVTGKVCCRSDRIGNLCPQCRTQVTRTTASRAHTSAGSAPPPPDFIRRLREAARSPVPSQRLLEVHELLANDSRRTGVPPPPNLTDMIQRLRRK